MLSLRKNKNVRQKGRIQAILEEEKERVLSSMGRSGVSIPGVEQEIPEMGRVRKRRNIQDEKSIQNKLLGAYF